MADPYVYPGTNVLINNENIRDPHDLETFERRMTLQRMREGIPRIQFSSAGFRSIHRHLFQDVYAWAGDDRTVNLAKGGTMFCLAPFVSRELDKRFDALRADNNLRGQAPEQFAERAALHICELNAVHPFRDGNGRTLRAFLEQLGDGAGHPIDLRRIAPTAWIDASIISFRDGDYALMRNVIAAAFAEPGDKQ
jgi:cell filamentation protein